MNKERFHRCLSEPHLLREQEASELEAVLRAFPWFVPARLLYVKALHNTEHLLYPQQLQTAAVHVPDRKALYEIIHLQEATNLPAQEETGTVIIAEKKVTEEAPRVKTVSEYIAEQKKEMEAEETAADRITQLAREAKEQEKLSEEQVKKRSAAELLAANLRKEKLKIVDTPGEQQLEEIRKAEEDLIKLDTEIKGDVIQKDYTPSEEDLKKEAHERNDLAKEMLERIGHPKKLNFSDWLTSIDEGREKPEELVETPPPTTSMEQIIDKFIQEEPRLSKPKKEFFNPVNMAKQSVEDDEDLVTETLAKIYLKQGNQAKALRIYDILALKYPEKSAYFAALIQEIKNKNLNS